MTADNIKINGRSMDMWKSNLNTAKIIGAVSSSSSNRNSTTRMDTFEISNREIASNAPQDISDSSEINSEKADIIRELSQSHTDVNRFLEIKAQVRAGNYEINQKEVAESMLNYFDFDMLA